MAGSTCCTQATATSRSYDDALIAAPQIHLHTQACPRFVEFVEAGITSGPELLGVAREYLAPLQTADIDTLILGCTHYPLLTGALSYLLGDRVTLVSSADECAKATYARLTALDLAATDDEIAAATSAATTSTTTEGTY